MEAILSVFFIIVALLAFSAIVPLSTQKAQVSPEVETPVSETVLAETPKSFFQPSPAPQPTETPSQLEPTDTTPLLDTFITSGPEEGKLVSETNKVEFEFKGEILSEEVQGWMTFQTKIEGFDEKWVSAYSGKRTVTLPAGPQEYTFLVRAKVGDVVDPTPAQRNFKINISPYFGKVKFYNVQLRTESKPSLIKLTTNLKDGEKIKITGWSIKGKGGSIMILRGIEKYRPAYNLVADELIYIQKGDVIYLTKALNPLGEDVNFRPNKCFGYLENSKNFSISVPKTCPKPEDEEISHLDSCCQEFIRETNLCEPIDFTLPLYDDCKAYLKKNFNYNGCFDNYSEDEDFLLNQWHIYLDRDLIIKNDCDTLYLLDQNGLFIDKYSYGTAYCHY
jgi:hypothetical protein